MKYFVYLGNDLLALLGFGASAWRVAPRDWYIGRSAEKRKEKRKPTLGREQCQILDSSVGIFKESGFKDPIDGFQTASRRLAATLQLPPGVS